MEGLIHLSATDYAVLRRSVAVLANCDLGDRQPLTSARSSAEFCSGITRHSMRLAVDLHLT
jgi:hypothetical protein